MGLPILRQHLQREAVVDILHHTVNGTGQFIFVVQVPQMAEMALVLIAAQRVLDVAVSTYSSALSLLAKVEVSL